MCPFLLYPSAAATFLFFLPDEDPDGKTKRAHAALPRASPSRRRPFLSFSLYLYLFEISLVSLYSLVQHVIERLVSSFSVRMTSARQTRTTGGE